MLEYDDPLGLQDNSGQASVGWKAGCKKVGGMKPLGPQLIYCSRSKGKVQSWGVGRESHNKWEQKGTQKMGP